MSEDVQTDTRSEAPVHFEHWCEERPAAKKWGRFRATMTAKAKPAGFAMSIGGWNIRYLKRYCLKSF